MNNIEFTSFSPISIYTGENVHITYDFCLLFGHSRRKHCLCRKQTLHDRRFVKYYFFHSFDELAINYCDILSKDLLCFKDKKIYALSQQPLHERMLFIKYDNDFRNNMLLNNAAYKTNNKKKS